jgi:predicted pPIWI-associating nuclease
MGAEIAKNFPYECVTAAPAGDPTKFDPDSTDVKVDTKGWFGDKDKLIYRHRMSF